MTDFDRDAGLPQPSTFDGSSLVVDPDGHPTLPGYRILDTLGAGGMGVVYRGVQLSTNREVALKVLPAVLHGGERRRERFRMEVELASGLRHPGIATVYDSGVAEGTYYYAMELVDGVPLDEYVRRNDLGLRQVLQLVHTVVDAVRHAHLAGVIHRDLKPSNILVDQSGQPHVLDFGLAKAVRPDGDDPGLSVDGDVAGTPAYMSPEQATGRTRHVDTRTDIYSLGVILCELLTGDNPHPLEGSRLEVLGAIGRGDITIDPHGRYHLDNDLVALLHKALALRPEDRYQGAVQLAEDIEAWLAGQPLRAHPPHPARLVLKWAARHRRTVAAAAVAVLLLVVMVAYHNRRLAESLARQTTARNEAEQALQRLTVAHLKARLVPLQRSSVVDQVEHLSMLAEFGRDHPELVDDDIRDRHARERETFIERIDEALRRHRLEAVLDLLAHDDRVPGILDHLDRGPRSPELRRQLVQRLRHMISVPFPRGQGQAMFDAIESLRRLVPDSPIPERALRHRRQWHDAIPELTMDGAPMSVQGANGKAGRAWRALEPGIKTRTVILTCRLKLDHTDPSSPAALNGDVALTTGVSGDTIMSLLVKDGRFIRQYPNRQGGVVQRPAWPVEPGHSYTVTMRCYFLMEGQTCDILVDDHYLVEDAPMLVIKQPTTMTVTAEAGTAVHVENLRLQGTDRPVRQDWGPARPVVTHGRIPIDRMRRWHFYNSRDILVHDFNRDGRAEVVFDPHPVGAQQEVFLYHVDPDTFIPQEVSSLSVHPWTVASPLGATGPYLGLSLAGRFGLSTLYRDADIDLPLNSFALYEFDHQLKSRRVFISTRPAGTPTDMVSMRYDDGTTGLAVTHGHAERGVELFRWSDRPGHVLDLVGFSRPRQHYGESSDINNARSLDVDGDGDTDLILGMGPWRSYCPLLVKLSGTTLDKGTRLTPEIRPGVTTVAHSRFDSDTDYVVSATAVSRQSDGTVLTGSGLRLMRVGPRGIDVLDTVKGDFGWIDDGRVQGRDVVAVTLWNSYNQPDGRGNLAVRLYTVEARRLKMLWELTLFDCRGKQGGFCMYHSVRPVFGDLDCDGNDELLLNFSAPIVDYGVLAMRFGDGDN